MHSHPTPKPIHFMNDSHFVHMLLRLQEGLLLPDEVVELEAAMRVDPAKRQLFADTQIRSMALHDHFRQEAFRGGSSLPVKITSMTRPIMAMAAGLLIGLFSASIVWAISSPKATTERLASLRDGSFEKTFVGRGFPRQTGVWSGDEASMVERGASDGRRVLRFLSPGADEADPAGPAISCDVFQIVDLRPWRAGLASGQEAVLELSARFQDGRPANTKPSVTFTAQIFLFRGDPEGMHAKWPLAVSEAIASAASLQTTLGGDAGSWLQGATRVFMPSEAGFAVIQLAARPNLRPAALDSLYADDVRLTLKTQPSLPVRLAKR
jgi:hypothetical protein